MEGIRRPSLYSEGCFLPGLNPERFPCNQIIWGKNLKPSTSFVRFFAILLVGWVIIEVGIQMASRRTAYAIVPKNKRSLAAVSKYPLIGGGFWRLIDHKGTVVVVNLWATWCGPCLEETPDLIAVANKMSSKVSFVGIAMDQGDLDGIRAFVTRYRIPYPIALGANEPAYSLGIPIPTTIVFDRQGKVALETTGGISPGPFCDALQRLVDEPN